MIASPVAFFDTECYRNYWLLAFRARVTGRPLFVFELFAGQAFTQEQCRRIVQVFELFRCVSFNGNGYDIPMIIGALSGKTPEQLKDLNDAIIVTGLKPWELGLPEWSPPQHVDIMEVAPGAGSQKIFAARIHAKTIRDLPFDPALSLTPEQIVTLREYNVNDLDNLEALHDALAPQLEQRRDLSERFGIDLMSKSDAQIAEAVLRVRCEKAVGRRLYKSNPDWGMRFRYVAPPFLQFQLPQLRAALDQARGAEFGFLPSGKIGAPTFDSFQVAIGSGIYSVGIGGLHSCEKSAAHFANDEWLLIDADVAAYYPTLILNSGEYPDALGPAFCQEYSSIKEERIQNKTLVKALKKAGDTESPQYRAAKVGDDGGKIMINGTFGKTGSSYSILFAPRMLIQTTLTGQFSLLMLIEWLELNAIPVVSANTDGIVIKCPRARRPDVDAIIAEWQRRAALEMETNEYRILASRDVNNYFAVKTDGDVKRKGEYAKSGLVEKKNPDVEICSDAVAEYLANGTPVEYTIAACCDVRKFVSVQRVAGGAVKMHGDGPRKGALVRDMAGTLERCGWIKEGRKWRRGGTLANAGDAYAACFEQQRTEYLGKAARWYYSTSCPGPIVYHTNGNTVGGSWGARPCMTLPDELPGDVDFAWYIAKSHSILKDIGVAQ